MRFFGARSVVVVFGASLATLIAGLAAAFVAESPALGATTLPAGFSEETVADGLSNPTAMAFLPTGDVLVTEQRGKLRIVRDDELLPAPVVDLSKTVDPRGERGLLGVAVDPAFNNSGYIYLYFTTKKPPIHNRVVRLTLRGDRVVPGSYKTILRLDNLKPAKNHNGGAIHFGEDRKLYVAVGDNADGENAQSLKTLKGKMLRISKNGAVPKDNPYFKNRQVRGKNKAIWARGLRNPFSFAVRPGMGEIFINDVGQKTWEEINVGRGGANYGWPRFEGPKSVPRFTPPIFAYRHGSSQTTGCAITGGAFYNPKSPQFPDKYTGDYFFADFCSGWIRTLDRPTREVEPFAQNLSAPVDIKVGSEGRLYYLERGTGTLSRVAYAAE